MRALVAVLLMSSVGWAQDNRALEGMVNRLKERLSLTEDQVAKVREIYAKDAQDRTQLDTARSAKVAELLTDEQKKQFEELQRNPRGGGQRGFGGGQGGGGGNNPFGGGRGMGQLNLDDLKRELTLTDEQAEKIKPILDEFGTGMQKRMEELRGQGLQGLNFQEEIQKFQDSLKGVTDKIKLHLTEEQKPKLDGMIERTTGWMRVLPLVMGRGGFGAPAAPSAPARPSVEDRVKRAMDALKVEKEEERAAIADLIGKVVRAQYDLEDYIKSSRETLGQAAKDRDLSDAAVEDRINDALKERSQREKALAALQKQLVEIVSSRQELELMVQGILK